MRSTGWKARHPVLCQEVVELFGAFAERIDDEPFVPFKELVDNFKRALLSTVNDHIINQTEASRFLQINRTTYVQLLRAHGLPAKRRKPFEKVEGGESVEAARSRRAFESRENYHMRKAAKKEEGEEW